MAMTINGTNGVTFPDASVQAVAASPAIPTAGAVGSYAWCKTTTISAFGDSIAGSSLNTASIWTNGGFQAGFYTGGTLSGTWRIMGTTTTGISQGGGTLYVRIA